MQKPHTSPARSTGSAGSTGLGCRLEIKHLKLVQAIASEGTVTHAAGRLHLSQSAVSHQLVDLERDLSTRLFDRIGKRMIPTVAGNRVLASAERLLSELASLERDLEDNGRQARIPMRITTSCYTSYEWLPNALLHFTKSHPRVDITIVLEATRRAMEALLADEVDIAIATGAPKDPTWASVPIVTSDFVAVASPKHEAILRGAHKTGFMKWRDLRGATVLVHDIPEDLRLMLENAVRDSWERQSGERLSHPIEIRKIPLTEALIELARSNSGVVIADRWMLEPHVKPTTRSKSGKSKSGSDDLVCVPFAPTASRSFHVVWRKQNPRALPMTDLAALIQQAGQSTIAGAGPRQSPNRESPNRESPNREVARGQVKSGRARRSTA